MKKSLLTLVTLMCMTTHIYALEPIYDAELQQIDGQAGADLSLYLGLNHKTGVAIPANIAMYNPAVTPQFDTTVCQGSKLEFCRLAIALNNRTADVTMVNGKEVHTSRGDNLGRKQWIVLKGIQGTINIPKLGLDGTDVSYGSVTNKAAIALSWDPKVPVEIRNFGFQSLSLETDTIANEGAGNIAGYLNTTKYTTTDGAFDANNPFTPGIAREKGFLGVNMNTNLSMTGTVKIFSCAPSGQAFAHPRC